MKHNIEDRDINIQHVHDHEHHHHHDIECHDHHHHHNGECHEHGAGCSCCAAKGKVNLEHDAHAHIDKRALIIKIATLTIAVILAIVGSFVEIRVVSIVLFVIGYLVAGYECIIEAVRHTLRGKVFDETFLMVVASVGAMCIGEMREGILVMVLFGIGEILEGVALRRSKRSISALVSLKQPISHVRVGGEYSDIPTDDIRVDNIIMVKVGERVPVDGIVIEGCSSVDNSSITGESMPIAVGSDDVVLAGGINLNEVIVMRATCEYKDTSVKKIIDIVESADEHKPKAERVISKFARYYTPSVVLVAMIVSIVPSIVTGEWVEYIHKALVFLVISCPCALVISVPLAIFSGIGGASRRGVLVKGGDILESISNVDIVAFDKTGTLTNGTFDVVNVVSYHGNEEDMLSLASAVESRSSHPISRIISSYRVPLDVDINSAEEIIGEGMSADTGLGHVLVGNSRLMERYSISVADSDSIDTIVYVAVDCVLVGEIHLRDTLKDGAITLVSDILRSGKKVVMLTGDREAVARAISDELGISEYRSELSPTDKKDIIDSYIREGKRVMFVGDGINDAPALVSSNIGVCNNAGLNDIAVEAGDVVLMNGKIDEARAMFKVSKKTRRIVIENIVFSLLVKLLIAILDMTVLSSMWLAVIADVGVTLLAILNSVRALRTK